MLAATHAAPVDPLGPEPPEEFRIFRAGMNRTHKGDVLFDDAAATSVMAAAELWGVDLMIDLDHMSLEPPQNSPREDVSDARGWFRLAVREGELWAVNVTWTADGARRVRERLQRYISPVALRDKEWRALEVINVALVASPATFGAQPLAASRATNNPRGSGSTRAAAVLRARRYLRKARNGS